MKRKFGLLMLLLLVITAFKEGGEFKFKIPEQWPPPVYNFSENPLSAEKIDLGRALFYDPVLSRDSTISCNSCHSPFTGFAHVDHALSHGIENRIGIRNAPALMNLAWQKIFMWDGAINHLDMQPLVPISNADEMNENISNVVVKLQRSALYPSLFYKAYGDSVITGEHTLKSIAQFMLTVVSSEAKYDSVMRKEASFTEQEMNGYRLYKANCSSCHAEPLFTNFQMENNGLEGDTTLKDTGRMRVTKLPDDSLKFKVPTLRNIEFTYPYMHDGRFNRLSEVLNHYTTGIKLNATLSEKLKKPVLLSSNDKVDIIAFLLTLTDRKFLFDQRYSYPKNIFYPKPQE